MLQVTIVSPENTLYEGDAVGVKVPGEKGAFEVLQGHAPIVSVLSKGKVECQGENPYAVEISGGFIEVNHDKVSVCVEL